MIRLSLALFIAETLYMEWEAHRFSINLGQRESGKFTGSDFITNHPGGILTGLSSVLENIEEASIVMQICSTFTRHLNVARGRRRSIWTIGCATTSRKRKRSNRAVDATEFLYLIVSDKIFREERRPGHFILNLFADEARIRKFNVCRASLLGLEVGRGYIGKPLQMVDATGWRQCSISRMLPSRKVMAEGIHVLVVCLEPLNEGVGIR
jgi:hypothetical protein